MQLTSFEKAKTCYEAGIKSRVDLYWHVYNWRGKDKSEQIYRPSDLRMQSGIWIPAPTLDEWLDWFQVQLRDHKTYNHQIRQEALSRIVRLINDHLWLSKELIPCDELADLALWIQKEGLL